MTKEHTLIFRTIIVGDSISGKTSFCKSYSNNEPYLETAVTIGVDFISKRFKIVNGPTIKIHIWDTAGQEAFKSIIHSYYRHIGGAIIMFDVTNKSTFDNIPLWLINVRKNHICEHEHPIILVGNKCDLIKKREISYVEAFAYAESENIIYMECSCHYVHTINKIMDQFCTSIYEYHNINKECIGVSNVSDMKQITYINNRRKTCCSMS